MTCDVPVDKPVEAMTDPEVACDVPVDRFCEMVDEYARTLLVGVERTTESSVEVCSRENVFCASCWLGVPMIVDS